MTSWRRWIRTGLLATVVLALVAVLLGSHSIERDLAARVIDRLGAEGDTWAAVSVSGRNVTISGTAPSTESQQLAMQTAAGVDGVADVENASDLLPLASPYAWSARRLGRIVTLGGNIPSESFRNFVLTGARRAVPDAQIHDEMTLARGAVPAFNAATAFALARLAELSDGMVSLTDATLSVSGVAADSGSYGNVRTVLGGDLPQSLVLGPVEIQPPRANPFVWAAAYDGKTLTFSGYVPNEVVHETLVAAAKASLPKTAVDDQLAVASGEPKGFAEAATFAVTSLSRLSEGGVTLDGLTLDVAGTAKSVDDYEALITGLAGDLPGGLKIVADDIKPATVDDYGWRGDKNGNTVVLSGYVPTLDGHNEIATAAQSLFTGQLVTDKTRIAAGEPKMDWVGGVKFAMSELAKLGHGTVELGDRTFSVEGEAATPEAFSDILAANEHTLPASLQLVKADISPPKMSPYQFTAESSPQVVVLSGYAPSETDKATILQAAQRKFGNIAVEDKLVYASGAPEGLLDAIDVAFQAMNRLGGASVEIDDGHFNLAGSAYYPSAADEIAAAAKDSLPADFAPNIAIVARQEDQPVDPSHCRDLLQAELKRGRIEFSGSKADISQDSLGLLDRIAATFVRCPDVKVEVGAHSDSEGSASKNRDLTQARAEAIVDYLVDAGVERERLTAVGYGESEPVGDNTTAEGKAANRRIEFTVELPDGG